MAAVGTVIDLVLLTFLVAVTAGIVVRRSLVAAVMLSSFFSLLMAGVFVLLDAVDVTAHGGNNKSSQAAANFPVESVTERRFGQGNSGGFAAEGVGQEE